MNLKFQHHFDAAHRLERYVGKCANIHGHRWTVQIELLGCEQGSQDGMVVDFTIVKRELKKICEVFDHKLVMENPPKSLCEYTACVATGYNPTAENLAIDFAVQLGWILRSLGVNFCNITATVYETPTNCASHDLYLEQIPEPFMDAIDRAKFVREVDWL